MDFNVFIENLAAEFEDIDVSEIRAETKFKELDVWSSLIAFFIIAMADEKYGVMLKGDDIRNADTVEDLFTIIKSKV